MTDGSIPVSANIKGEQGSPGATGPRGASGDISIPISMECNGYKFYINLPITSAVIRDNKSEVIDALQQFINTTYPETLWKLCQALGIYTTGALSFTGDAETATYLMLRASKSEVPIVAVSPYISDVGALVLLQYDQQYAQTAVTEVSINLNSSDCNSLVEYINQ